MRRAPVLSRMLSLGVLALLPAYTGCASGTVPEDAGSSDADSTPQDVELRFSDTSALQLTPRENVTVELHGHASRRARARHHGAPRARG
jgi:hypothetical protein